MINYKEAYISSIETAGMLDGPGIRTVIFFSGCPLRCIYCHNPETWATIGKKMNTKEVFDKIIRNKSYFKNGGGVTFSGGEPLLHLDFLIELTQMLKKESINIVLDTSGSVTQDFTKLFKNVDIILLDVKATEEEFYKKITGSDIRIFDEFLKQIQNYKGEIWIRQVIIPGYNDNLEYIKSLKNYIAKINNVTKIEFLPYHNYGEAKYKKLNLDYALKGLNNMDREKSKNLYKEFTKM